MWSARQRLVAHLAEVLRARVGHVDHHLGGDLGPQLDLLVGQVPPGGVQELREQLVRAELVGLLEQAALGPDLPQPLRVALVAGALGLELELDQVARHHLEQAEVQERDAAVADQQEVARVRVAAELPVAVHAAEVEAEDDLADAVARGLVGLLDGVEADALDELADHHLLAREAR